MSVQATSPRLASLDAFRGATMLLMASSGLGLPELAAGRYHNSAFWRWVATQCEHAEWSGCTAWDFIQPAFMFMVGVAVPYSLAKRCAQQSSTWQVLSHGLVRAGILVALAVFLSSAWSPRTEWVFTNVLAQIGLGYPVLLAVALWRPRPQWFIALLILIGTWALFALWPLTAPPDQQLPNTQPAAVALTGFAAHWQKNANVAASFDRWFLNLFPRPEAFVANSGGYHTLNFVPSISTMIFGLLAGQWLRSGQSQTRLVRGLVLMGALGIVSGLLLHVTGVCPIIKRLWTPSWALMSSGVVAVLLAGFFAVIDVCGHARWAFPLIVAGLNPMTLYCLWQLSSGFIRQSLTIHLGPDVFIWLGSDFQPLLERLEVLVVLWLVLWWMHRQRIYVRI